MNRLLRKIASGNLRTSALATIAAAAIFSQLGIPAANAQQAAAPLEGASSIQEVYQDWQVNCIAQQNARQCSMLQRQNQMGSNQLVIAVELVPEKEGEAASGIVLLPFGLLVASGITLQVDDKPVSDPVSFRTCMPAGCVVPVTLDKTMMAAARSGTALKVSARPVNSDEPMVFSVSLKGFAQAYDRLKTVLVN